MLPLCIDASTGEFLQTLAVRVHRDEALVESPPKRAVVDELLKAALSKIDLFPVDNSGYTYNKIDTKPSQAFILSCVDTDCTEAGFDVVDKVTTRIRLDKDVYNRTVEVLIPLVSALGKELESRSLSVVPPFISKLQAVSCDIFLDALIAKPTTCDQYDAREKMMKLLPLSRARGGIEAFLAR